VRQLNEIIDSLGSERTKGYGPRPIPSDIDDDVRTVVQAIAREHGGARADIIARLTEVHGLVLNAFAERMAAYAVRNGQARHIQEALDALAIALPLVDYREVIPILALLFHSAEKIGLDARTAFEAAMVRADAAFQRMAGGFLTVDEESRSIATMCYIESTDQDGFRYKRTW
jgi:hypothetical protein